MKKCLKKLELKIYHVVKGKKIDGVHAGVYGDVTGIWGDVTGIYGDVNDAKLTDNERLSGIDVSQLIKN